PRADQLPSPTSFKVNFQESEAYLLSLGNEVETMKLGLENITALLAALGDPQTKYKKVQVAGTNGKGSVCAFLDSICRRANIRTGLYTSPHLISITERIKIDGVDISEDEFARLATRVQETAEGLLADGRLEYRPTFFEQVTAIALLAFAAAQVELGILETGLGGRYDAVTAAKAEIAAITRIDLDHQEYLGDTIEEIAAEKAAIIRSDSLVVLGDQSQAVIKLLLDRCDMFGLKARTKCEASTWAVDMLNGSAVAFFRTENAIYDDQNLGLKGRHQIENAKIAIMVAEALRYEFSFSISGDNIANGLEKVHHPGRLQRIGPFIFDGAHNPSAAKALGEFIDEFVHGTITMIFGAMSDKSVAEIAVILWPRAEKIILTRPSNSRAMSADELLAFAPERIDVAKIVKTGSVAEALETARKITPKDGLVLVTGSLYLVGEVKKILNN
ncbi:MAG: bifunctional folylpolyglutamate synthase/dihydrofolate synthase, partial [bacterium]|nr:bifunctional folylpolyglutamate synthase/dihydrofolate synthase [bacterium]